MSKEGLMMTTSHETTIADTTYRGYEAMIKLVDDYFNFFEGALETQRKFAKDWLAAFKAPHSTHGADKDYAVKDGTQ
jgi:hypothetical protein